MKSALAFATVTATIRQMLLDALTAASAGTAISGKPDDLLSQSNAAVNIYLLHVTPNMGWCNEDLPTRRPDGSLRARPRTAYDMHYVLSFFPYNDDYGSETIMGYVLQALHNSPFLDRKTIENVVKANKALKDSSLAKQIEQVKLSVHALPLDELSKYFGMFPQMDHLLSIGLTATTVIVEADQEREAAPPVRRFSGAVIASADPVLTAVRSSNGQIEPIMKQGSVTLEGSGLGDPTVKVLVDGSTSINPPNHTSESIQFTLPAAIIGGVHSVQVTRDISMGDPPTVRTFESNSLYFAVQPLVLSAGVAAGDLTVKVDLGVTKPQIVFVLLNKLNSNDPAIKIQLPDRAGAPPITDLVFPLAGVPAGKYVVRIRVDNAEGVYVDALKKPALGPTVTV